MQQHFPRTWGEEGRKVRKTHPFWVTDLFHSHFPLKMLILGISFSSERKNAEEKLLILPFKLFHPCSICHCWNPFLSVKTPQHKSKSGRCLSTKHDICIWIPSKPRSKPQQCPWTTCPEQRGAAGIRLRHSQRSRRNNCAVSAPITDLRAEAWLPNDRQLLPSLPSAASLFGKNPGFLHSCASRESC